MQIQIEFLENKITSAGKNLKEITFKKDGKTVEATLWELDKNGVKFPNYDTIAPGSTIECELWNKPGTENYTIYPPRTPSTGKTRGANIEKMMEKKSEYIEKAQDRKNESISFFNATNNAIALLASGIANRQISEGTPIKELIVEWRNWFLDEWRKYEAGDVTDKHNAF